MLSLHLAKAGLSKFAFIGRRENREGGRFCALEVLLLCGVGVVFGGVSGEGGDFLVQL